MPKHDDIAKQLGQVQERILTLNTTQEHYAISAEQEEREKWQAVSNAFAEATPMYAVARSVSLNYAILPLEPLSRTPLVKPELATRDEKLILEWWQQWPEANIGVPVGRANNLIALHVEDRQALRRLWRLARVEQYDPDSDKTWTEYRELDAGVLQWAKTVGVRVRTAQGWGRAGEQQALATWDKDRPPEELWLLWSYPSVQSGMDAHDFPSRRVGTGLQVLGPGEVIAWAGSVFEGSLVLQGAIGPLPEMPQWLASKIGKPRSRKVMQAQREAFEAAQRATTAHVIDYTAAREQAQVAASTEVERARVALDKAEKAEPNDDELPPVIIEDVDEEEREGTGWLR